MMMNLRVTPMASVSGRPATPCAQLTCQPRCSVSPAAAAREHDAHASEATVNRRHMLSLPILLPVLAVATSTSQPAIAATGGLPGQSVPGAVDLDGEVTLIASSDTASLTPSEKQVYNQNIRIQAQNRTPDEFPGFIRVGFDVKVVGDNFQSTPDGLLYRDFSSGSGSTPVDGNEVVFHYTGYNESGTVIDSSYRQGRPAQTRLGVAGMIPGFEMGIRSMKVGQQRRIIIPPALGPPVGPSTFFSAKQCEVFDIELLAIRTCQRRQLAMFSDVVCT